jgi:hypothetical protein
MSIDLTFPGDENVAAVTITPDAVKKYYGVVKNLLRLVKLGVLATKTKDDDEVFAQVEAALAAVEPYLDEPAVYDLLNFFIGLFKKDGPVAALEALKSVLGK